MRPDKTIYYGKNKTNLDDKRKQKKPKISSVQDKYFSKYSGGHDSVDFEDLDSYIKKVEKKYHELRKKEWEKAYKENYKTRYPEGGKYGPKI